MNPLSPRASGRVPPIDAMYSFYVKNAQGWWFGEVRPKFVMDMVELDLYEWIKNETN